MFAALVGKIMLNAVCKAKFKKSLIIDFDIRSDRGERQRLYTVRINSFVTKGNYSHSSVSRILSIDT